MLTVTPFTPFNSQCLIAIDYLYFIGELINTKLESVDNSKRVFKCQNPKLRERERERERVIK